MLLTDARELLDRCFAGVGEGAPRLLEPAEPRFALRPSAVWLEYRWYVHGRGLAEVFLKWARGGPGSGEGVEASVLRVHLLGTSQELASRARGLLEGGVPERERLLDVLGDDGVRRECAAFGRTRVTVEQWAPDGPHGVLEEARFLALAGTLEDPDSTPEARHEAVQRLAASERSARVVDVLLGLLERRPSLMALRVLSEWGEVRARGPLRRDLALVLPDNASDLWALTALERRLEAWAAAGRGP